MIRNKNYILNWLVLFLLVPSLRAAFIPVTDANFATSLTPINWVATSNFVNTTVCGASFKVGFRSTQNVKLLVDNSHLSGVVASRYPIIAWTVSSGTWQSHQLAEGETSVTLASGMTNPIIDLYVKGMSPFEDRYNGDDPRNSMKITGFEVDDGGATFSVVLPEKLWLNIGDSIMSGDAATFGAGQGRPADDLWAASDDGRASYGYLLARHYGYREVRLAYGGYNWSGGLANVPALATLIDQKTSTISRINNGKLDLIPDVVLINLSENGAPSLFDVTNALFKLRSRVTPTTKIIVMTPVSGAAQSQVTQAFNSYAAAGSDTNVFLVNLRAISFATADGQHPTAQGHQSIYQEALSHFDSIVAPAPLRICPMGDSITVGFTDNPNWSVPFQFGYRSGLYTRLKNANVPVQFVGSSPQPWNGISGTPTNTPEPDLRALGQDHHEGYSGQGTAFILSNIGNWITNDRPDVILLQTGINDIGLGSTAEPANAEANLSNIVAKVVSLSPQTHLVVAQITPYSSYTAAIVKYNNYIATVLVPHFAGQGKRVSTMNQYASLCVPGTTNIDASLFANGINHPGPVAYDRMAQTWFAGLEPFYSPLPTPTLVATPQYAASCSAFDGALRENLIRVGQPTLSSVSTSHGSSIPANFTTAGLNDGGAAANPNYAYYANTEPTGNLPVTITFNLNTNSSTGGSPLGYDVKSVQAITGWFDSNLANQQFQLLLSISGGAFQDFGTFTVRTNTTSLNSGNNAILQTLTNAATGIMASRVTGIQFVFSNPGGSQGGSGGTLIRELQVMGAPTGATLGLKATGDGNLQLTWSQGRLLETTNFSGDWVTNGASSPYNFTPTGAQKFFRVISL